MKIESKVIGNGHPGWVISQNQTNRQEHREHSIIFVGDTSFARGIAGNIEEKGVQQPFELLDPNFFESADILVFNHECCLSERGARWEPKPVSLRAHPRYIQGIGDLPIQPIANLANNHFLDYGPDAAEDTIAALNDRNITYFGVATPSNRDGSLYLDLDDITVGFLGFAPAGHMLPNSEINLLRSDLSTAQDIVHNVTKRADVVIVSLHQGIEYSSNVPRRCRQLARTCIDAGADLVIGHHSHIINGIEEYKGRLIFHGLGNFVMDGGIDTHRLAGFGLAVRVNVQNGQAMRIQFEPLKQSGSWQPAPVTTGDYKKLDAYLRDECRRLNSSIGSMLNDFGALVDRVYDRLHAAGELISNKGLRCAVKYYLDRLKSS